MGKKYQFKECDYKATRKSHLIIHQQSVHMGKKYPCEECDHKASNKSGLTTHHKSVHMGKKYLCEECDYQFTKVWQLFRYSEKIHNVQEQLFRSRSRFCVMICTREKYLIVFKPDLGSLNSRHELLGSCRHKQANLLINQSKTKKKKKARNR